METNKVILDLYCNNNKIFILFTQVITTQDKSPKKTSLVFWMENHKELASKTVEEMNEIDLKTRVNYNRVESKLRSLLQIYD